MNWEKNKITIHILASKIIPLLKGRYLLCLLFFLILFFCFYFLFPVSLSDKPYSTLLLDRDGEIIGATVADDGQFRFPQMNVLPPKYVIAVLTFEDKRFLCHKGVDLIAISRAAIQNLKAGSVVSGASTLSMQVIRLACNNPSRTWSEKIKEMMLALRLEQEYSKYEILLMYASQAPFGGNIVGLRAAAVKYFDRQPEELSWAEAALLAVLPNAPSLIFPGRNNHLLLKKRDLLLKHLYERGCMQEDDYKLALTEPLPTNIYTVASYAPHLLVNARLKNKGQVCQSYIDTRLQQRVNDIVKRHSERLSYNHVYNAAVLVAHIPTGEVRAYVGNSPSRPGSRGNDVDIITSVRSSGSILKPSLYALMLDKGKILPTTLIADIPSRFGGYAPSNFNRDFRGVVSADKALSMSLNVPFVRMLREYDYHLFYEDLKRMGITSLNQNADHYGLSLILGGAETSLWDVCNMYAGMASVLMHYNTRDGSYLDNEYKRLRLWHSEETKQKEVKYGVVSAASVWFTLKALGEVERPELESGWKNFASNIDLFWKTGTSFGFRDAWAVGVNGEYVIGVWVGNADGEGRPGLTGVRVAAPLLFEVAALLPSTNRYYQPVEEMEQAVVCRVSGHRASDICPVTDTLWINRSGSRTVTCPYHRLIHLDQTGMYQVNSECEPVHRIKTTPWFVLSPVQEWYYTRMYSDYKRLPPFRADCRSSLGDVMEMIYPSKGVKVFIPRELGGEKVRVVFEMAHREPRTEVYWHIDESYVGTTRNIHQLEINVEEGRHLLTLVDAMGNMLRQYFTVVGKDT